MELKIEYLSKNDLKPYVNNAKIHTDTQVEQIKKSIQEFGFDDPIAVWGENEIVEGHGRLLAAMEMDGLDTVPVIRLDHLTDKQRKAYALAHNKLTMNTDFDLDILAKEVANLEGTLDLTDFGFNEAELLELEIDDSPAEIPVASAYQPSEGTSGTHEPVYSGGTQFNGQDDHESVDHSYPSTESAKQEIDYYAQKAEQQVTRRVIIVYSTSEEEMYLKNLLAQDKEKPLGVVLDVKNIIKLHHEEVKEDRDEEDSN